ncbi:Predicted amidohydrolase [Tistlia consotensis]|uniref:Predicted amidohydrolase n=1 Tax=Tistlia consotensis USBA 355 TaxID=560819 RepID=A0A1Y6B7Q1_9PROT|nr:nitrilase-related carbon-nitrogen hydrolase [Tistlia consotensis]SME89529.1 Predicted amidohydrolase [Tistlia consotensis USBA 355]SNR26048.1 Predicted amidohydrolase [Tistlia consotensis]
MTDAAAKTPAASPSAASPPDSLKVALWATNIAQPLNGLDGWAALVDRRMAEARAQGAELLVMPEYCSEQWLSFAPAELKLTDEIAWMAAQSEAALAAIRDLPAKHDMALLAGTLPVPFDPQDDSVPPFLNRAHLLLPDGRIVRQDKLCLTPGERDPAGWNLSTGDAVKIVEWKGVRLATLICLDVEMPALSSLLAPLDLDLLLVPSMTSKLSGYSRVFGCAKARAVELQCAVATVGVIGSAATGKPREGNVSGASLFVPCEEPLGHTGKVAEVPPAGSAEDAGPLLVAEVPLATIRELKQGKAEVWPGAWRADHVKAVKED